MPTDCVICIQQICQDVTTYLIRQKIAKTKTTNTPLQSLKYIHKFYIVLSKWKVLELIFYVCKKPYFKINENFLFFGYFTIMILQKNNLMRHKQFHSFTFKDIVLQQLANLTNSNDKSTRNTSYTYLNSLWFMFIFHTHMHSLKCRICNM